jgi:RNA polymerase sigma factor (sigma-70 family)
MIDNNLFLDFFDGVLAHDEAKISKAVSKLRVHLLEYLRVMMKADLADSEDVVQNVFLNTINTIRDGAIDEPSKLGSYIIKATRNQYFSLKRRVQLEELDQNTEYFASLSEQIDALVEQEKYEALQDCVEELDTDNKAFIRYWLSKPDEKAEKIAEYFKIKINLVFTKKHRIIKMLANCVSIKIN